MIPHNLFGYTRAMKKMAPKDSLGFSLSQLGLETARQFSLVVGEFGLEPRDFAVLFAVSQEAEQSQQGVGERLSIPASSMVAIVDRATRWPRFFNAPWIRR